MNYVMWFCFSVELTFILGSNYFSCLRATVGPTIPMPSIEVTSIVVLQVFLGFNLYSKLYCNPNVWFDTFSCVCAKFRNKDRYTYCLALSYLIVFKIVRVDKIKEYVLIDCLHFSIVQKFYFIPNSTLRMLWMTYQTK